MQLRRTDLRELHCITPIENVPSIVHRGILCHERARAVAHISYGLRVMASVAVLALTPLPPSPIAMGEGELAANLSVCGSDQPKSVSVADNEVQARRALRRVPGGLPLHQYANLYIEARNVMMYVRKGEHLSLCVLRVSPDVLDLPDVVIADRNAAADLVRFGPSPTGLALIDRDRVFAEWWNESLEARQVRCAEVLVPGVVPPRFLLGAYVSCDEARRRFDTLDLTEPRLQATIYERLFYR